MVTIDHVAERVGQADVAARARCRRRPRSAARRRGSSRSAAATRRPSGRRARCGPGSARAWAALGRISRPAGVSSDHAEVADVGLGRERHLVAAERLEVDPARPGRDPRRARRGRSAPRPSASGRGTTGADQAGDGGGDRGEAEPDVGDGLRRVRPADAGAEHRAEGGRRRRRRPRRGAPSRASGAARGYRVWQQPSDVSPVGWGATRTGGRTTGNRAFRVPVERKTVSAGCKTVVH